MLTVDGNVLHSIVANSLYSTQRWANVTTVLDMLLTGDMDEDFVLHVAGHVSPATDSLAVNKTLALPFALSGIHCLDRAARAGTYQNFLPAIRRLLDTSKIMGGGAAALNMICAQWKLDPKERYQGDFQVRPRNPVLVIGNTYDGHTPLRSAYNVSSGFENSVVLEVNGYGVGSRAADWLWLAG